MSISLQTGGRWSTLRTQVGAAVDDFAAGHDPNTDPTVPEANLIQAHGYQTALVYWTATALTVATDQIGVRVWHYDGATGLFVEGPSITPVPCHYVVPLEVYGTSQFFVELYNVVTAAATGLTVRGMGAMLGG